MNPKKIIDIINNMKTDEVVKPKAKRGMAMSTPDIDVRDVSGGGISNKYWDWIPKTYEKECYEKTIIYFKP